MPVLLTDVHCEGNEQPRNELKSHLNVRSFSRRLLKMFYVSAGYCINFEIAHQRIINTRMPCMIWTGTHSHIGSDSFKYSFSLSLSIASPRKSLLVQFQGEPRIRCARFLELEAMQALKYTATTALLSAMAPAKCYKIRFQILQGGHMHGHVCTQYPTHPPLLWAIESPFMPCWILSELKISYRLVWSRVFRVLGLELGKP